MDRKDLEMTLTNVYLGLPISNIMHWGPHINLMCKKANQVLVFHWQNHRDTHLTVKEKAYRNVV